MPNIAATTVIFTDPIKLPVKKYNVKKVIEVAITFHVIVFITERFLVSNVDIK
jgi:hypothetical protein